MYIYIYVYVFNDYRKLLTNRVNDGQTDLYGGGLEAREHFGAHTRTKPPVRLRSEQRLMFPDLSQISRKRNNRQPKLDF